MHVVSIQAQRLAALIYLHRATASLVIGSRPPVLQRHSLTMAANNPGIMPGFQSGLFVNGLPPLRPGERPRSISPSAFRRAAGGKDAAVFAAAVDRIEVYSQTPLGYI